MTGDSASGMRQLAGTLRFVCVGLLLNRNVPVG